MNIVTRRTLPYLARRPVQAWVGAEVVMRCLVDLACGLALAFLAVTGCTEDREVGSQEYAWCSVDPPSFSSDYWAVSFVDPNIGTVVGGIYRTTDGGRTWTEQESPVPAIGFGDVFFADASTGTLVGATNILRTTDGGTTWVVQDSGANVPLTGLSFTDADTGMVVGFNGTILGTTDGGETWVAQDSSTNAPLWGVWLFDANTATAVGESGTILRTTDGGATWVTQESGIEVTLKAVSFADVSTGTAVGEAGTMLRTTDGGATWTAQESGSSVPLNDVWFVDANVGTVVGGDGMILRTTDGGATWVREASDADIVSFPNGSDEPIRSGKTFHGVSMTDPDHGVAVGEFSGVVRRLALRDTFDACDPWCAKSLECSPDFAESCAVDCLCNLRYHGLIGAQCEAAVAASMACFAALSCEQIEAYFDDPDNHPCTAAEERLEMVCVQ